MNDKETQAQKLITLAEDPSLAVYQELCEIKEVLANIAEKEIPDFPAFPEMPEPLEEVSIKNFPDVMRVEVINQMEMPRMECDMSMTNSLLRQLLDKESEQMEITVDLNLV